MSALVKVGLVVLAIIAGVVWLGTYRISCSVEDSKRAAVAIDIRDLAKRLESYKVAHGDYPGDLQLLSDQVRLNEIPRDPWQHEYIYRNPGVRNPHGVDLFSAGADRLPGTADDDWGDFF